MTAAAYDYEEEDHDMTDKKTQEDARAIVSVVVDEDSTTAAASIIMAEVVQDEVKTNLKTEATVETTEWEELMGPDLVMKRLVDSTGTVTKEAVQPKDAVLVSFIGWAQKANHTQAQAQEGVNHHHHPLEESSSHNNSPSLPPPPSSAVISSLLQDHTNDDSGDHTNDSGDHNHDSDNHHDDWHVFHRAHHWLIVVGEAPLHHQVVPALELGIRCLHQHETAWVYSHSKFAYGHSHGARSWNTTKNTTQTKKKNIKTKTKTKTKTKKRQEEDLLIEPRDEHETHDGESEEEEEDEEELEDNEEELEDDPPFVVPAYAPVLYRVTVESIIKNQEDEQDPEFQLRYSAAKKRMGNDVFAHEWDTSNKKDPGGRGKTRALQLYHRGADTLQSLLRELQQEQQQKEEASPDKEDLDLLLLSSQIRRAHTLLLECLNNIVAVHLRSKHYGEAKRAAVAVLQVDPHHPLALLRAAKAALLDPASSYEEVHAALQAAQQEDDPMRVELQKLIRQYHSQKQAYKKKAKTMATQMMMSASAPEAPPAPSKSAPSKLPPPPPPSRGESQEMQLARQLAAGGDPNAITTEASDHDSLKKFLLVWLIQLLVLVAWYVYAQHTNFQGLVPPHHPSATAASLTISTATKGVSNHDDYRSHIHSNDDL